MEQIYRQLGELARRHGARKLVLFGSRARGDFRERSDIDLAVYGMPPENRTSFWLDMLASRNITSHVYDDAQAAQIVADIDNHSPYGFG